MPEKCDIKATRGKYVNVHYTGTIAPESKTGKIGSQFDSSTSGAPFSFPLGEGFVIKGWDYGVEGMCVGEKRVLTIPPEWGYGNSDTGSIPAGATLRFEVELVSVGEAAEPQPNMFEQIDTDKDGRLSLAEVTVFMQTYFSVPDEDVNDVINEVMTSDDKDKDGFISWDEFTGPKGTERPVPAAAAAAAPADAAPAKTEL